MFYLSVNILSDDWLDFYTFSVFPFLIKQHWAWVSNLIRIHRTYDYIPLSCISQVEFFFHFFDFLLVPNLHQHERSRPIKDLRGEIIAVFVHFFKRMTKMLLLIQIIYLRIDLRYVLILIKITLGFLPASFFCLSNQV